MKCLKSEPLAKDSPLNEEIVETEVAKTIMPSMQEYLKTKSSSFIKKNALTAKAVGK
jgi:hypothetical protein